MEFKDKNIELIIILFRHGSRESYVNFKDNTYIEPDVIPESINITINKGKKFIEEYIKNPSNSSLNQKDFKGYISDSIRTIKTFLYRISPIIEKIIDFEKLDQKNLKEYTIKNFNCHYDNVTFNALLYCTIIIRKFRVISKEYKNLVSNLKNEIKSKSEKALNLVNKYYTLTIFNDPSFDTLNLGAICDYLFYSNEKVKKTFSEEEKIIRDTLIKLEIEKKNFDYSFNDNKIKMCLTYKLMEIIRNEIKNVIEKKVDKKKLIIMSGHDTNLASLLIVLNLNNEGCYYKFDDEIKFIIYKINNIFNIKILYNEKLLYDNNINNFLENFNFLDKYSFEEIFNL